MIQENDTKYNWNLENSSKYILNTYNTGHSYSINTDAVFKKVDSISNIDHIFKDDKHRTRYVLSNKYCITHNWFEDTIKIYAFGKNIFYCSMAIDFLNKDFSEIVRGF